MLEYAPPVANVSRREAALAEAGLGPKARKLSPGVSHEEVGQRPPERHLAARDVPTTLVAMNGQRDVFPYSYAHRGGGSTGEPKTF